MESRKYQGLIINRERLRRNWSQEELCKGICTVSYLSKIETGKADPSDDILRMLFKRLGLIMDEKLEKESHELSDKAYDFLFSGMNDKLQKLLSDIDVAAYRATNYGIDLMLLKKIAFPADPDLPIPEESLIEYMEMRQLALYKIIQRQQTEAVSYFPNSYTYLQAGIRNYTLGNNIAAIEQLITAYDLAARRGFARIMLRAKLFLGNCYSNMLDSENMILQYEVAGYLAQALNDQEALDSIAYNTASLQIQKGDYEEAYSYFASLPNPNKNSLLKLAICCEMTGRNEEGIAALDRADLLQAEYIADEFVRDLCRLVRYRLGHDDYLEYDVYGQLLKKCYDRSMNEQLKDYSWFLLVWMIEWLKATRQYKKACRLLSEFPNLSFLKDIK